MQLEWQKWWEKLDVMKLLWEVGGIGCGGGWWEVLGIECGGGEVLVGMAVGWWEVVGGIGCVGCVGCGGGCWKASGVECGGEGESKRC